MKKYRAFCINWDHEAFIEVNLNKQNLGLRILDYFYRPELDHSLEELVGR